MLLGKGPRQDKGNRKFGGSMKYMDVNLDRCGLRTLKEGNVMLISSLIKKVTFSIFPPPQSL